MRTVEELLTVMNAFAGGVLVREIGRQLRSVFFRKRGSDDEPGASLFPVGLERRCDELKSEWLRERGARHALEETFDQYRIATESRIARLETLVGVNAPQLPPPSPPSQRMKSRPDR